jgi:aminoglycoside 3-N-acetyltransferase
VTDADLIAKTDRPRTRESITKDLTALGVRPGSVLLVHSSVAALGWVAGGPVAVVQGLLDALGPEGTLVVPTHTPDNSDPDKWSNPPVPEDWWPVIRESMPAFDPAVTPSRWMGAVAEMVRTWPGARRSDHPVTSFAALGPAADDIVSGHRLDEGLGDSSPLGRVYHHDGDVLLLGVGHGSNTSLHLAEYRVADPPRARLGAAVRTAEGRAWTSWEDVDLEEDDFERLGVDLDATDAVTVGPVGSAHCRLMRQRAAVDFAVWWFTAHRR